MTSTRFDAALRSLAEARSRRQTLAALVGGLPSLVLLAELDDATAKKGRKKNCKRGKVCAGKCGAVKKCKKTFHCGPCQKCDVCQKGCAFSSVQAAIDAAAPGDTIRLCAGSFEERLDIRGKILTLSGAGDGQGGTTLAARGIGATMIVDDSTVTLERLRVTAGRGAFGGGISSERSTLTLTACTVSGNNGSAGGGIHSEDGDLTLRDCVVSDNAVGLFGGGIFFDGGSLLLVDSRVEGNTAGTGSGGGIFRESGTVTLQDSVVTGNTPDNCVGVDGCG